jgi:VCBS repeat-containing protein
VYQSGDGATVFDIQIDAAGASSRGADAEQSIVFPDKDVLFTAEFRRSGTDLLLLGYETTAIIAGYFGDNRRLNITTYEGASLTGATVEALAGPHLSGQYAQAADTAAALAPIGRVEKVSGSATVLRNGVSIELRFGDVVAKGDVVQTGADSSLTIKFHDGTVFSLSSSARMVLNDMVYAADSSANSALFTLVQGVIGFVAGRIAKTGDLKVDTPVATMAIRGTAVQTEIAAFSGTTKFSLLSEPNGTAGSFVLLDKNDPSRVITSVSDPRVATLLTPLAGSEPRITQITKTADDIRGESDVVRDLFQFVSTQIRRGGGSSDVEDGPIVPARLPQRIDPLDPSQPVVTQFVPERAAARDIALPPPIVPPAPIRGSAIEDGLLVRLGALPDAVTQAAGMLPHVIVQSMLPPGVRYLDASRSFSLDPSHPAYQKLGEGETEIVTVDYLLIDGGVRVPSSISWTIAGRNDAPVTASDHIVAVDEVGQTILTVRDNDRDVDSDSLQVIHWTAPLEGSVFRNASGDLVFDPRDDFVALSTGETATVTFAYTASDGKGGTDTANVTLQVRGEGTFSSPQQFASENSVLTFNHQPVSIAITAPSATTTVTADLDLVIGLGPVLQPQMNIVYLIDISGSTLAPFEGSPVADLNGDGQANTVLDAEIASLTALTERVRGLGFSAADVTITVIPFNGSADPTGATDRGAMTAATFSLGQVGDAAIPNYLRGLDAGGQTNFADALRAANSRLQSLDQGKERNFLYFLSDGNGQGSFDAELANLNSKYAAKITALGVGEEASLSQLDKIDNTGKASLLTAPDQIDISVLGAPFPSGMIADIDLFVNDTEIVGVGPEDLVPTAGGLALDMSIGGLKRLAGDGNTVSAIVRFVSGEVLATELAIAGALPRSIDDLL